MSKNPIDKEYLISSLKNFDREILSKKYDNIESIKQDIRRGYQHILDEGVDYIVAKGAHPDNNDNGVFKMTNEDPILRFRYVDNSRNMQLTDDGFVKLVSGKTYVLFFDVSLITYSGSTLNGISMTFYDRISDGNVEPTQHISQVSKNVDNYAQQMAIVECKQDMEVALKLLAGPSHDLKEFSADWNGVKLVAFELKQSVVNNVDLDSFIKDSKENNQDAPVGNIISYMGTIAPKHYLACDGSVYNITDYPKLADHFYESFGSYDYFGGDGIDTFAVPDLRGEFLRGTGTNSHEDQGNGSNVGEHQDGTLIPSINISNNSKNLWTPNEIPYKHSAVAPDKLINKTYNSTVTGRNCFIADNQDSYAPENADSGSGFYSAKPTNTSVLYCIKYEPTYFFVNGDYYAQGEGSSIGDIAEVIDQLETEKYLPKTSVQYTDEVVDNFKKELSKYGINKVYNEVIEVGNYIVNGNITLNTETGVQNIVFTGFEESAYSNMELSPNGYALLKAGKIYILTSSIAYLDNSSGYVAFRLYDVTHDKLIGNNNNRSVSPNYNTTVSAYKDLVVYKVDEDTEVTIQIQNCGDNDTIYTALCNRVKLSAIEIAQPVINNVNSDSWNLNERIVGTWINSKPLYEKSIRITYDGQMENPVQFFLEGDLDMVNIVQSLIYYTNSSNNRTIINGNRCDDNATSVHTYAIIKSGEIDQSCVGQNLGNLIANNNAKDIIIYMKVQYTKTNDSAAL